MAITTEKQFSQVKKNEFIDSNSNLVERYQSIRNFSEKLCDPLSPEDCTVQSMPDASPAKWHLAHTTWFFETFLLTVLLANPI